MIDAEGAERAAGLIDKLLSVDEDDDAVALRARPLRMLTSLTPSGVEHNRLRSIMLGISNAHLSDALRR